MACNSHRTKGGPVGLKTLGLVKESLPDVQPVVFGARDPVHPIPAGIDYRTSPPQDQLVETIYNGSRVFLNSSNREGFGLPCIEAMACGCALVTTDNGGSRDYARHGVTALVAPAGDAETLAHHVEALLRDDDRRLAMARAGRELTNSYDWDESGRRIESFLRTYGANPSLYQGTAPAWDAWAADRND